MCPSRARWAAESSTHVAPSHKTGAARSPPATTRTQWPFRLSAGTPEFSVRTGQAEKGPDYGDAGAWQLPAGTFVQALGACGVIHLAKLGVNGGGVIKAVLYPGQD